MQVKELEREIAPLKDNVRSLTSQKNMLVGEKTGLKNEVSEAKQCYSHGVSNKTAKVIKIVGDDVITSK